jgi:hypothetical protein
VDVSTGTAKGSSLNGLHDRETQNDAGRRDDAKCNPPEMAVPDIQKK